MTTCLRVLCLGNELLADDAFGPVVADRLASELPGVLEVVKSSLAGLALLDELTGVSRLVVIDSVQTGNAPPGTLYILHEDELKAGGGPSPHYLGIFETLRLARHLGLPAPEEVTVLAVEAADCATLGGPLHPAVLAAVPKVVQWVAEATERVLSMNGRF
jgi:hydrogenase maturation protease